MRFMQGNNIPPMSCAGYLYFLLGQLDLASLRKVTGLKYGNFHVSVDLEHCYQPGVQSANSFRAVVGTVLSL